MPPRLPPIEIAEIFSSKIAVRALLALERLEDPITSGQLARECGCAEKRAPGLRELLVRGAFVDAPLLPGHGKRGKFQISLTPHGRRMAELLRRANEHALAVPPPSD